MKGLHYDWFTALELPFSEEPFAAPEYLARFGFLVDPSRRPATQPGNLPGGLQPAPRREDRHPLLDITCAACHTGELRYQGKSLRIDGGAAMHSIAATVPTLRGGALARRSARAWPPPTTTRSSTASPGKSSANATNRTSRNCAPTSRPYSTPSCAPPGNDTCRHLYPTEEGPGRTDAFGRIANSVFGDAIDPGNYRVANAPVSYPQVWDIWKFDWVQWRTARPCSRWRAISARPSASARACRSSTSTASCCRASSATPPAYACTTCTPWKKPCNN
ncbi:di-heme-cytochrome C peroxidase [Pseudomonas aeruginosa]|nr:di-heme-cytochrome C peroxidase [Pseudomonas aeruginosa]